MASSALQAIGFILGVISWAGMIATCASPEWRKNSHGQTLIDKTLRYDGLWVRCRLFASGQTTCNGYNSFFIGLPDVLQVCRALMITALVLGFVAIIITIVGMKCTNISPSNQKAKAIVSMIGGLLFGIAAIFVGASVSYYAHEVTQEYYNPVLDEDTPMHLRFEYGVALFIGWASLVVGLLSGISLVFISVFIILRINGARRRLQATKTANPKTIHTSTHVTHASHPPNKQSTIPVVVQHTPHNKQHHSSGSHDQPRHHNHHTSSVHNGSVSSKRSKSKQHNTGARSTKSDTGRSSNGRERRDVERRQKSERKYSDSNKNNYKEDRKPNRDGKRDNRVKEYV